MGVTAGGAGKQTDKSAESDWGFGGGGGGGVELCGNLAQQQASRRGGGGGAGSSKLRIFSLSLLPSLLQVRFK
jgi:hypothetical protein